MDGLAFTDPHDSWLWGNRAGVTTTLTGWALLNLIRAGILNWGYSIQPGWAN